MGDFTMPSLGADMDRGTLVEWRVGVGDQVRRGDIIAVVDTDKSAVDVEVFEDGVVQELLIEPGTEVPVGTTMARIGSQVPAGTADPNAVVTPEPAGRGRSSPARPEGAGGGDDRRTAEPSTVHSPLVRHLAERLGVDTTRLRGSGPGHRITRGDVERASTRRQGVARAWTRRPPASPAAVSPPRRDGGPGASPLARRRAQELGVDLAGISGSGPGGAVRAGDLPTTADAPSPARPPAPLASGDADGRADSVRRAIARQMAASNRDVPHYHLSRTVDLRESVTWLERRNGGRSPAQRLLAAALLVSATARAAARHPELNGWWIDDRFQAADGVHLAIAVALRGGGLQAPVIHHADELGVEDTMAVLRDLVARSRRGSLRSSEVSGASLTLTDLGDRGADSVHGIIHPPQVALVGFGRIAERPWASDGLLGVRPTVVATLAADHRATDGHTGSVLLAAIDELLQRPSELTDPRGGPSS